MKKFLSVILSLVMVFGVAAGTAKSFVFADDVTYTVDGYTYEREFEYKMIDGWRCEYKDIEEDEWYTDAVEWAVLKKVFRPEGNQYFPEKVATRAELIEALYNACNRPYCNSDYNPFKDVKEEDSFYDAVVWAYDNEILFGTSATTFSPKDALTRAQVVAILWRLEGSPENYSSTPFTDLKAGSYYEPAAKWAYDQRILAGDTPTTFAPDRKINRAEMLTFYYRYFELSFWQRDALLSGIDPDLYYEQLLVPNGFTDVPGYEGGEN